MEATSPRYDRNATVAALRAQTGDTPRRLGRGRWQRTVHFWLRWAHVYISMFSLLVMLFFGITGITLNHPDWAFGTETTTETVAGVLPADALDNGDVEFLAVSEFIRTQHDVVGDVSDFGLDGTNGAISYKAPGYSADLFFDSVSGDYSLSLSREGFVGVMNELHKGRDADSTWRWIIDISGALLVVIGVTGIGIQLFLRKRRFSALTLSAVGAVLTILLIWAAMP